MRLMIAIPCGDTVRYEFAQSLANLCKHLSDIGIDYDVEWLEGSLIYMARDELANRAINGEYDYVFWLDSDMRFSPDVFDLLRAAKEPFVTGIYRSRRSPYAICLAQYPDNGTRVIDLPAENFEVSWCGFGCVLMKTEVLYEVRSIFQQMFTPTPKGGEDISFCQRWRDLGGKVIAVPDAKAEHITYVRLRSDDPHLLVDYGEKR